MPFGLLMNPSLLSMLGLLSGEVVRCVLRGGLWVYRRLSSQSAS
jgi:hypothetical protein